jgi:peptidoglycan hydrolase CwlO-like protein
MSTEIEQIVLKLVELDEKINELKEEKKNIDDDIKELEEGLIKYCQNHSMTIESVTKGQYNVKPATGRRLKRK